VSPTSPARTMRVFSLADGVHTWRLRCVDAAGNAAVDDGGHDGARCDCDGSPPRLLERALPVR
jgi:hypothetical protein